MVVTLLSIVQHDESFSSQKVVIALVIHQNFELAIGQPSSIGAENVPGCAEQSLHWC